MNHAIAVSLLALLLLGSSYSPTKRAADDLSGLYDAATLNVWGSRYAKSSNALLRIILNYLSEEEYQRVANVRLEMPLRDPMLFNFYSRASEAKIVMAVSDLKFLDDLCTAYAWLSINSFRLEPIEEYIAALKYKRASDFPKGRYLPPLTALKIPANALTDKRVDELALRLFNSARLFILAHELGHIYFGHPQSTIDREEEADQFAIEIARRVKNVPMGMVLFFQATAWWFPNRADFGSDRAWQEFLNHKTTHPLSAGRLRAIAAQLAHTADDFGGNERDAKAGAESVRFISTGIDTIAEYLEDVEIQQCVAEYAIKLDLTLLAPRRRASDAQLNC